MTDQTIAALRELEAERSRLLVAGDHDAVAALLADDLVHIHATGQIDDKAAYLDGIRTKLEFVKIERPQLDVRVYGSVAVSTGIFEQTVRVKGPGVVVDMKAAFTHVWRREGDRWLMISFQATKIG